MKTTKTLRIHLKPFLWALLTFCIVLACGDEKPPVEDPTPIVLGNPGENNSLNIWLASAEGDLVKQLTFGGDRNWFPAWSPDGKRIAYCSDKGSPKIPRGIKREDWTLVPLTEEEISEPDFHKRGIHPMKRGTAQVWIMDADGSGKKQLTFEGRNAHPAWSPDGKTIAFNSTRTGCLELWLMDADGSNQRQLTFNEFEEPGPWENLRHIELQMHGLFTPDVKPPISIFPTWSPDGRKIAFCSIRKDSYAIWVINADGSNLTRLTFPHGENFPQANCPMWSPVDDKIAFWSGINVGPGYIWVIDADGSNRIRVSDTIVSDEPSWSADGSKIVYTSVRWDELDGLKSAVWIANADGTDNKPLIKGAIPGFNRASWRSVYTPEEEEPEEPKYLIFWDNPDNVSELPEMIGTKGDGETRLLGFGTGGPMFDREAELEELIREGFATAKEKDLAVIFHYGIHYFWKNRPDLWNWFDPDQPGYDPGNKMNVEWHDWDGPPNRVRYLNWGVLERIAPHMSFTSEEVRAEITRIISEIVVPVTLEELEKLKNEGKETLFVGILVGDEPSIDDYSDPNPERAKMIEEDGVPAGPLGYRALMDRGYSADNPPEDFRLALAEIIQESVAFWCKQFVDAGIPPDKLYPHVAAPAPIEMMNAPIWTAFNEYCRPGWTTYPVMVLGQNFNALYDELSENGNPPWAGIEANAGFPGSVVDWETYLGWHYNHGCVVMGINNGATGEDLPRRLRESSYGEEAIAAYQKFFNDEPLEEKEISMDHPAFRIQAKMRQVQSAIQLWREAGKDPSEAEQLLQSMQSLMTQNKMDEVEQVLDKALELLGETEAAPDVYGQDKEEN